MYKEPAWLCFNCINTQYIGFAAWDVKQQLVVYKLADAMLAEREKQE